MSEEHRVENTPVETMSLYQGCYHPSIQSKETANFICRGSIRHKLTSRPTLLSAATCHGKPNRTMSDISTLVQLSQGLDGMKGVTYLL